MHFQPTILLLLLASLFAYGSETITIPDGSFDDRALNAGTWSNNISPWLETGGPNNGSGFVERISGFSADGQNHLGMMLNHDVWQDLAVTYQANTRYTLTVAVGHRSGHTNSSNQSEFHLADNTGAIHASGVRNSSTIPVGTFVDATPLVFETPSSPDAIGRPIRILLRARGGGRAHFDNIRLVAETLVPPGGAVLSSLDASGVTATGATLGVIIDDPGADAPVIRFFWGAVDGGIDAGAWEFSETLPGTHTTGATLPVTGLVPGGTYRFTARAENPAGFSWATPSGTFETLPAPPVVATLAATEVTAFTANLRAEVTDTGGSPPAVTFHYGPTDGGTDAGAWQASMAAGIGEGVLSATLGGLDPSTPVFFRASAENAGGMAWAANTESFTTLAVFPPAVETQSPTGITGASATLRGLVTDAGNDPPTVTIFLGTADGGTDPGQWSISFNLGPQSAAFASFAAGLAPETEYLYRARATNAAGTAWSATAQSFTTTALIPSSVVINEFHYKPADESTLGEFIELHNPGDTPADISNWRLTNAVSFTFPAGTVIGPGDYLVVAQDPAVILAQYGVEALGPYSGALSSRGERINLRDAADNLIDRVEYGAGFPWPAAPDGGGPSVERIHPSLDGNLAGSWRASGTPPDGDPPAPLIALQESGWRFFRGTAEASDPIQAWRDSNFDDSGWETGQAPLGYGVAGLNTTIEGMRYNYSTVYLRKEFTLAAGTVPDTMKVRLYLDDGCVIWINGTEVHRRLAPEGDLPFNTLASTFVSAPQWYEFTIENVDDILFGGTNTIAVHLLNSSLGSSDLAFDIEITDAIATTGAQPTPGHRNSVFTAPALIPPHIDQVAHSPQSPHSGQSVTITARITDPDGVASASIDYQLVDPGAYIRLTDPDYATEWTNLPMSTDGTGIWSATIPGTLQTHRRLVRYRINFQDTLGNAQTVPYADDESPNFAYFVSDGIPAWQGAFRPGETPIETFTAETLTSIPVYTLIANDNDVINSQYNSSSNKVRMTGTFVHDGVVHDHIQFRNRGEGSIYQAGKNKWRFYFNRGSRFQANDAEGNPHIRPWKQFSGNPGAAAWAPLNRGAGGLDEMVPFRAFQLAGVPSPHTHHYHFRVIRGEEETPPAGTSGTNSIGTADRQYHGDFWGLYLAIEPIRGNFLNERDLPNGSIYKIEGNNGDKKEQGVGLPTDSSDWIAFRNAHVNADPTETWWRENLDLEAYYSFHAINRLTGNVDLRGGANHYFYHRGSDNRWVAIPWDLDMMFIAKRHWGSPFGNSVPDVIHAHKAILQHPQIALEYRNRAREILDLLASDATASGGQFGQLVHEIASRVHTPDATDSLVWADAHLWNLHPRTNGTDGNASGQGNHRGNFFRSPFTDSRNGGTWTRWLREPSFTGTGTPDDTFTYFLNYATDTWPGGAWVLNNGDQRGYGYQFVLSEIEDAAIPEKPTLTYTGAPGFPTNQLTVTASDFADPQGPHTFAAREWRVAEVGAPGLYEIEPLWSHTTNTSAETTINLPSGIIQPDRTYRARVRQQDDTGRWSHWSDPVEFTATPGDTALIHYWNFNSTSSLLAPTQTAGGASIEVTGTHTSGTGQDFAAANARFGDPAASHLRINNPLTPGTSLDITAPTTGFSDIVINYETRRSGSGAGLQTISYTLDGNTYFDFTTIEVTESPEIIDLDFRPIPTASNNPDFAIRITFSQGDGDTAGNNRFDNLTVEGVPLDPSPRLIPVTNALWNFPENWHHLEVPDSPGAPAILDAPENGNRAVTLTAPVTIGDLAIDTGEAGHRNRINGNHPLTFDNNGQPANILVTGDNESFAELDIDGGLHLATDLIIDTQSTHGDPEHGALRLRRAWTGPGGIIKQGPGMASLTGTGKDWIGETVIAEGVLNVTGNAAPGNSSAVRVFDGGQLRLISTGTPDYTFGGTVFIAGSGRGEDILDGAGLGKLGAIRYEPGSPGNHATLTNRVELTAAAGIHVATLGNQLTLAGGLAGEGNLTKSGGGALVLPGNPHGFGGDIHCASGSLVLSGSWESDLSTSAGTLVEASGACGDVSGEGTLRVAGDGLVTGSVSGVSIEAPFVAGTPLLVASELLVPAAIDLFFADPSAGNHTGGIVLPGIASWNTVDFTAVRVFVPDADGDREFAGQMWSALPDVTVTRVPSPWVEYPGAALQIRMDGSPADYAAWADEIFEGVGDPEVAGPMATPFGDGVANLLRFALGTDETGRVRLPVIEMGAEVKVRFPYDPGLRGLRWRLEAAENLASWEDAVVLFDSVAGGLPDATGLVEVVDDSNLPRRFYRLRLDEE